MNHPSGVNDQFPSKTISRQKNRSKHDLVTSKITIASFTADYRVPADTENRPDQPSSHACRTPADVRAHTFKAENGPSGSQGPTGPPNTPKWAHLGPFERESI